MRRSDQWPFLQRGVAAMGFMTGLHPDYHTQYDRPEKINYVKMEKIARLVHQASWGHRERRLAAETAGVADGHTIEQKRFITKITKYTKHEEHEEDNGLNAEVNALGPWCGRSA